MDAIMLTTVEYRVLIDGDAAYRFDNAGEAHYVADQCRAETNESVSVIKVLTTVTPVRRIEMEDINKMVETHNGGGTMVYFKDRSSFCSYCGES